ncbi:hypothetical protein CPB86DRAFT_709888 [Serendipita vermifera]|nr:hypothetical protein CPB86DRAFT_709888 [Serendipita vermifera]
MAKEILKGDDLPWYKVEDTLNKVQDDDQNFPMMDVWTVSFKDPKKIKVIQEYLRGHPSVWESVQHLKLINKKEVEADETLFQVVIGISSLPPTDLPAGFSPPERVRVPATPSLTRAQLQEKNKFWPTVFTPHLQPSEITFTREEVEKMTSGMRMAVKEARQARVQEELPIAACILPDQYLDSHILAHDTRTTTHHPLRHAVLNLVRKLSDKVLETQGEFQGHTTRNTSTSTPVLQNGEGYQLTNRTLFITHEPCLMCTMALVHSRVKEVVFIYPMNKSGGCGGHVLVPELPTINHRFRIWCWKKDVHPAPSSLKGRQSGPANADSCPPSSHAYASPRPKKFSPWRRPLPYLARKAVQMLPISTFVHMTEEDDFGRPLPNTSPLFNSPNADLVLSSSNSYHFRVHRAILSEASPIFFAALASLPPHVSSEPPPVQDLAEDGETIAILLQYIYPMSNPQVTSLQILRPALVAAQKYEIHSAIDGLRTTLVTPNILETDPLGVYAIACELGLKEEAKIASRATLAFDILAVSLETPCLENLSAKDYLRLVRLHQSRAEAAIAAIDCMAPMPHDCCGYSNMQEDPSEDSSPSQSRDKLGPLPYVRWFITWKAAAVPELKARPRSNVIFDPAFLLSHVKRATRHCTECGPTYMASATQAWLRVLKERVNSLPDTI